MLYAKWLVIHLDVHVYLVTLEIHLYNVIFNKVRISNIESILYLIIKIVL